MSVPGRIVWSSMGVRRAKAGSRFGLFSSGLMLGTWSCWCHRFVGEPYALCADYYSERTR